MTLPSFPANAARLEGRPRRVGVELEFADVTPEGTAEIVRDCFGGQIEIISPYEYRLRGSALGDFGIEVDLALLKRLGRELAAEGTTGSELKRLSMDFLASVTRPLVPVEIVSPPLAVALLERMDELVPVLRKAGAKGTFHAPLYAFGVHLNPEVPSFDPLRITDYLRAFMCLYDWLKVQGEVDFSRSVTPFINRFPEEYEVRVLDPAYRPDLHQLVADYLEHNATRNRALDMLPLFAHLAEPQVRGILPGEKIHSRPTFHYRLPNCEIDRDGWLLTDTWRGWLQVEHLAGDRARLQEACRARLRDMDRFTSAFDDQWRQQSLKWLTDL